MSKQLATFLTEISKEDFEKMNLTGWFCPGGLWTKVSINEMLEKELTEARNKGQDVKTVCVAIHTDYTAEDVQKEMSSFGLNFDQASIKCLHKFSYLDKILTPNGKQTYVIGIGVDHIFSIRNWWESHTVETFRVPKKETASIFMIHI